MAFVGAEGSSLKESTQYNRRMTTHTTFSCRPKSLAALRVEMTLKPSAVAGTAVSDDEEEDVNENNI